jgi:3'-phosphoadenosine 5'-phosphosulfate sulfotransferase (PAPS reductase)/FAD synthetase
MKQIDVDSYERIIIACSGGKDSVAALLHLLDCGAPVERMELWHHDVDGQGAAFMDWPSTTPYVRALAQHFGVPCYLSWREGGLQDRFLGRRTLFVTGERAEESPNRARYTVFGPHRTDTRDSQRRCRHVDHWRPVHAWSEAAIWAILQRYGVIPALPYQLGFGRLSCALCVFMSVDQAATLRHIMPERFSALALLEQRFGCTMKRECGLHQYADRGVVYAATLARPDLVARALEHQWHGPVVASRWRMPAGAFWENVGPG